MRNAVHVCAFVGFALVSVSTAGAQTTAKPRESQDPPPLVVIYREEVKPGKAAAHTANEQAWATAFTKGQAPIRWLGMTSISGPSEAWFVSAYDSYAAFQKTEDAMEASAALSAEQDKYSAEDGELLTRTSAIIARYRPALSYQPKVPIPQMRYMQVDIVQVKPGHGPDFTEMWTAIVAGHEKAKMNEHWAVYAVESGMPAGTFLFMYPHKSLDHLDGVAAMHTGDAYRDAIGEAGRAKQNQMAREGLIMQQTLLFAFRPRMSLLSKDFIEQDPGFWTPKPVVAQAPKKTGEKR